MQIEGRNPVIEILKSKHSVKKIIIESAHNNDNEKIAEILKRAENRRINIQTVGRKKLNAISVTGNHQGVIAIAILKTYTYNELLAEDKRHGLDSSSVYIRDALLEDNIGAIARTAEAAGIRSVVIPPKMTISPQMFRSSMGALAHIKICQDSLFPTIKIAHKYKQQVVGIEVSGENYYYNSDLSRQTLFIIGGEDRPLSEPIVKKCDFVVKIPLRGKINSLNMSVAASIVLYERVRQLSSPS